MTLKIYGVLSKEATLISLPRSVDETQRVLAGLCEISNVRGEALEYLRRLFLRKRLLGSVTIYSSPFFSRKTAAKPKTRTDMSDMPERQMTDRHTC